MTSKQVFIINIRKLQLQRTNGSPGSVTVTEEVESVDVTNQEEFVSIMSLIVIVENITEWNC